MTVAVCVDTLTGIRYTTLKDATSISSGPRRGSIAEQLRCAAPHAHALADLKKHECSWPAHRPLTAAYWRGALPRMRESLFGDEGEAEGGVDKCAA